MKHFIKHIMEEAEKEAKWRENYKNIWNDVKKFIQLIIVLSYIIVFTDFLQCSYLIVIYVSQRNAIRDARLPN